MQFSRYGSLLAIVYDAGERRHESNLTDLYVDHYDPDLGPALEPMCGTGFYLMPLLERGYDADGVDGSPGMLDRCREKCRAGGYAPGLYQQRLQELDLPRRYGYIYLPEGSFSHLYEREVAVEGLRRIHEHLLPGGKLVLQPHAPMDERWETKKWQGGFHECEDGSIIARQVISKYEDGDRVFKCVSRYELFRDGALEDTQMNFYAVRFYENAEFARMLAEAGFAEIEALRYEEGLKSPYGATFACRKPA